MSQPSAAPLPVSVIVLAFNEEQNIEECLQSVSSWAGEIFLVDSGSTDRTVEIARRYTSNILEHPFENYARQRNWAQDHVGASHEWILHVDADERVTPELRQSIAAFLRRPDLASLDGAMFSRRTVFMGRWIKHGGHYPVYHTRLFRPEKGRCEDRLYDQHFTVQGNVARLDGDLVDILTSELDTWCVRHVRWAGAEAREHLRQAAADELQVKPNLFGTPVEQRRWLRKILFGRFPLFTRAFLYFLYRYFFRLGFLDGTEGLIFHFLQGCWFRFYVDAKIWEIQTYRKGQGLDG